jgi:hypothetical protein
MLPLSTSRAPIKVITSSWSTSVMQVISVYLTTRPRLLTYFQVQDEIYLYSKAGDRLSRLASDFVGAVSVSGREKHSHFFVTMSGFNSPGTVARYDFTAPEEQRWSIYRTTTVKGLNPDDFEAQQVCFRSE